MKEINRLHGDLRRYYPKGDGTAARIRAAKRAHRPGNPRAGIRAYCAGNWHLEQAAKAVGNW